MSSFKRLFDVAGACAGLLVFAPVMALVAVAVCARRRPAGAVSSARVGYRRRPFSILKFRSMRDGRVTRMGRLLRATGLDEIPQFINILPGRHERRRSAPAHRSGRAAAWLDGGPEFDFRWETGRG